ncbi:MAG: aromatic ring-hydroxylating dioxygenase subunit alpha [Nannocystaceae bacterium]
MVPQGSWYVVLESKEVRPGKPLAARRFGLDMVMWRDEHGAVRAVADRCPHRGAALSAGKVRDGHIECPFHGFRFDGEGTCVEVPCNGPEGQRPQHLATRAFVLREEHGFVWMWWGQARDEYPPVPWFEEVRGYEYGRFTVDSQVSWMRNVENQLDWAHLPFIHRTTIGAGFDPQVEVRAELRDDRLVTWLERDEHSPGQPTSPITLALPNLWLNPFWGKTMMGMIAFVPVDETSSRMYFRTYTRPVLVPGLARVVATLMNLFNRIVIRQDLRVVATQPPGPTTEIRDERLVQADLPIARFRQEIARRMASDEPLVQLRPHG